MKTMLASLCDPRRLAGQASSVLSSVLGSRAAGRPGILVYHRVSNPVDGLPAPTMNVRPARFRRQLAGLQARGYRFCSLETLLRCHAGREPVPPRTVVVTFDDGFGGVFDGAWPALCDLGIPATVFLNTAFLDRDTPFPFDDWGVSWQDRAPQGAYRPLTTDECRVMAASGLVELAAHTHTHADFRGRPLALEEDLRQCVGILRERFGRKDVTFAFPFGRRALGFASDELLEAARRTGVTCALTTEADLVDPASDPFGWGRFNVYDWDTPVSLSARLDGWYGWAPRLQEWLEGRRSTPARRSTVEGLA